MTRPTVSTPAGARSSQPTVGLTAVIVSSLSADAISSTSIRLSWQLLQLQPTLVDGFRIKYRSLDSANDGVVDYLVKTVRPGDVTQFLLTGEFPPAFTGPDQGRGLERSDHPVRWQRGKRSVYFAGGQWILRKLSKLFSDVIF